MGQSRIRMVDGERYRVCGKCGESLPDTEEFFYWNEKHDALRSPCKACIQEKRYETNVAKPCCVPGCTNPRYKNRSGLYRDSRCREHMVAQRRLHNRAEAKCREVVREDEVK